MVLKTWRGDASEVAQVWSVTPVAAVSIGDKFSLLCNSKRISVTATEATVANVVALFAAAIAASQIPEWQEITATVSGNFLILTAGTAGVPFIVTTSPNLDALEAVSVVETALGAAGVNCIQTFKIGVNSSGTFTIVLGDQKTSALSVGASAATVQTALRALSTIGASNCNVTSAADVNDTTYTVEFVGALAGRIVAPMLVSNVILAPIVRTRTGGLTTDSPRSEIQTIQFPDGNLFDLPFPAAMVYPFKLTLNGQQTVSISSRYPPGYTQSALNTLTGVQGVGSTYNGVNVTSEGTFLVIEFTGENVTSDQSLLSLAMDGAGYGGLPVTVVCPVTVTNPGANAVNEVQKITLNGAPTGGTFTLTFGANTTSALAFNVSAASVQSALQGLASIGAGNATVTGSNGGPFTVTFVGTLAAGNRAMITANGASLTGATTDTLAITVVTASTGPSHYDEPANWSPSGVPVTGDDVVFDGLGADCLYGLSQAGVTLAKLIVSMGWENRKLGLPNVNPGGYLEYREQQLTAGITSVVIGTGDGNGPARVYLDTGSVATSIEVRNSGSSQDNFPAVLWMGSNAANTVTVFEGDFGTAPYSDTTCSLDSLFLRGGQTKLWNTAITTTLINDGTPLRAFEGCTLGGKSFRI
jgi:trimeric autotransporter adhesin